MLLNVQVFLGISMSKRKKQRPETTDKRVKSEPVLDFDVPRTYQRGWFGKSFRYFGVFMLFVLNLSMVMSFISRLTHVGILSPFKEGIFFLFLGIIDTLFLIPLLFEANKVETTKDFIKLHHLFWWRTLTWDKIESFEVPKFFKFSVIKTARCFYLINKYDLKPFDDLARTIEYKTSKKADSP